MEKAGVRNFCSTAAFWLLLFFSVGIMIPENIFFLRSWAISTPFEFDLKGIVANASSEIKCLLPMNEDGTFNNERFRDFPIARFSHMLPAALWSFIIPLQFSSSLRKQYPHFHRLSGKVFFLCDVLMVVGLIDLCVNNLMYSKHYNLEWYLSAVTGTWFAITGALAWHYAYNKSFELHKKWIIRHACVGNGVHLQRVFIGLLTILAKVSGIFSNTCSSSFHQWVFAISGYISSVSVFVAGEIYLNYLTDKKDSSNLKKTQ
jgi:hypothetical protein